MSHFPFLKAPHNTSLPGKTLVYPTPRRQCSTAHVMGSSTPVSSLLPLAAWQSLSVSRERNVTAVELKVGAYVCTT